MARIESQRLRELLREVVIEARRIDPSKHHLSAHATVEDGGVEVEIETEMWVYTSGTDTAIGEDD